MAQCMYPYKVEKQLYHNQKDRYVPVPCGKCPNCLKRRVASWSFRLEMESLLWNKQYFLTLTYDNEHVPITKNGFLTLEPTDLTLFFKKLRKRAGKLKYYLCGEYGTNTKRPHYHVILFSTSSLFESDIESTWYKGKVHYGKVEPASIRYTVQYYDKGVWSKSHVRDDRYPEFSRMSQGIGRNFLTASQVTRFLNNPQVSFIYNHEGQKISIPRYYKKRLYDYFGSSSIIANHPSILIHRDEMLIAKEKHHEEVSKIMQEIEIDETITDQDRFQAIKNYAESKRKTRK
jgi:hypothetical protein